MMPLLKTCWRRLRMTQPFNAVTTRIGAGLTRVGFPVKPFLEHLPYVGIVDVPLPGGPRIRLRSYGDDYMLNHTFWNREYEPETTHLFFHLARRANVCFDIGAHVGFYALTAAVANPQSSVVAFEPMPRIVARLQENIALNPLSNIRVVDSAVGRKNGHASMYHVTDSAIPSNSTLRLANFQNRPTALSELSVPVMRLEDFLNQSSLGKIDLLKIDTEGTELDVLAGLGGRLAHDRPSIICEILPGIAPTDDLEKLLKPCGYRFYLLGPKGPSLRDHIVAERDWWNYLFTPLSESDLEALQ